MNRCDHTICRMIHLVTLLAGFFLLTGFHWWDPLARWIGIGNRALEAGDADAAGAAYDEAVRVEGDDERIAYNRGLMQLLNEDADAALKQFEAAAQSTDAAVRADAAYNAGCVQLMRNEPAAAVQSFIDSLRIQPENEDAKANLEMALRMLRDLPTPTPQSQQQQSQEGAPDDSSNEEETAPTPTPSGSPEAPPPSPEPQSEPSATPSPESGDPSASAPGATVTPTPQSAEAQPVQEGKMSPEEAERLLDAQEEEEMEVLKRFHMLPPPAEREIEKDW
ncbi:hypothetical protein JXA80_09580 [bacterium]|nr:hypothetical protein [candidate division CSSED10-310 bacterium]